MKVLERIIERLIVCWHVLTKRNYVFFALDNNAVVFDEEGKYNHINKKRLAAFDDFDKDFNFNTQYGVKNIAVFVWGSIADFAYKRIVENSH